MLHFPATSLSNFVFASLSYAFVSKRLTNRYAIARHQIIDQQLHMDVKAFQFVMPSVSDLVVPVIRDSDPRQRTRGH